MGSICDRSVTEAPKHSVPGTKALENLLSQRRARSRKVLVWEVRPEDFPMIVSMHFAMIVSMPSLTFGDTLTGHTGRRRERQCHLSSIALGH